MTTIDGLLQNWNTARSQVRRGDSLDVTQYMALIKLQLREAFRSPAASAGKKTRPPIVSTIISMAMFGYLFYLSRRYCADLYTYLICFFTTALCIIATGVVPDTSAVYQRNIDVLHSRPVNERTHLAAGATIRLILILLLLTPYSVVPLIGARFSFDACWPRLAGSYAALIAAGFSTTAIWFSILTSAVRWISADRYRAVARYGLLCMLMLLVIPALAPYLEQDGNTAVALSLSGLPIIKALPSSWFAAFFTRSFDLTSNLQRGGALSLLGAAICLSATRKPSMYYAHVLERMAAVDKRPTRRPIALRIISTIRRLPLAGKLLVPDQAFSIASLITLSTSREDTSRLRSLSSRFFVVCIFGLYLFKPNPVLLVMISFHGFSGVGEGLNLISRSSFPEACWPLVSGPVEPQHMRRGIHLAVLWGYFALPATLSIAAVYWDQEAILATALALAYIIQARVLLSLYLILNPRIPLSQTAQPAGGFGSAAVGLGYTFVSLIVYGVLFGSIYYLGLPGVLIAAAILLMLFAASYLVNRWACSRMMGLELA